MPLESLIRHYLYGRWIASARIRNFLVLEYGRVTDKKKTLKKTQKLSFGTTKLPVSFSFSFHAVRNDDGHITKGYASTFKN